MRVLVILLLLLTVPLTALADGLGFKRYHQQNEFLLTSPGALKFGLYGYDNPAGLHHLRQADAQVYWTSDNFWYDDQRWLGSIAVPGFSFSLGRDQRGKNDVREYNLAFGGGSDAFSSGFSVGWYRGDTDQDDLQTHFTLGLLSRPNKYLSIGLTGTVARDTAYHQTVMDVAVRPFGGAGLTLFADYALGNDESWSDGQWSIGAASELISGLRLTGRYFDDGLITAGLQLSFGHSGFSVQRHRAGDSGADYQSYGVRLGAWDRSLFSGFESRQDQFMLLNLDQEMAYQRVGILDRRQSLLDTLRAINAAQQDPTIGGVVVNTAQMQIPPSLVWEIKSELDGLRAAGKTVVVYVENGGMSELLLTSAADWVVMDPVGTLLMPGFVSGSTYLADLLEHWGIGVEEFRNLEFKTAFENLSRDRMSEPDRQQRQAMIDSFYELWQSTLNQGRGLDRATFDALINNGITLTPEDLVAAGLVNELARFSELGEVLEQRLGFTPEQVEPESLRVLRTPRDDHWGPTQSIAVIYATGMTATDSGMRTRQLAEILEQMREDRNIKAVVLRVDSPGGGILASDLLAQEIRKIQAEKPVVVSMGSLATSGGYWVSMHAGTLVAAPNSITGSIGVTGVRLWDDGLGERLRVNSDFVKRGESADIGFGIGLPVAGLALPHRPLTDDELHRIQHRLDGWYDSFVAQAAQARGIPEIELRELAAGRVYSGLDAVQVGLVDELGSLTFAIDMAAVQAGLTAADKIRIVESPRPGISSWRDLRYLVDLEGSASALFDPRLYRLDYLEFLVNQRGQPMVLLPYEYFEGILQ